MDSNKDESDRCIKLAERYIEVGYREQAEKFLLKAEVLYPSQKAKDLFTITKYMPFKKNITHDNSATEQEINPKLCLPKTSENTLGISDATVTRIHRSTDYYEMLGVTKSSSHVRIKKAYRKLALQLHPDKNKRAGAAEAFKIIRNAVAVLTDNEKRKMYDLYGMDEMNSYKLSSDDSSPNSSDSTIPFRKYSQAAESQKETCQERKIYAVIQFLPILLAIGLSLVSSMMVAESNHCAYPSIKYPMVRMTYNLKIPYYVKHNFWTENSPLTIRRIEMNIEEDHINFLQNACYSEKCYRQCFSLLYYNLYSYFKYLGYY